MTDIWPVEPINEVNESIKSETRAHFMHAARRIEQRVRAMCPSYSMEALADGTIIDLLDGIDIFGARAIGLSALADDRAAAEAFLSPTDNTEPMAHEDDTTAAAVLSSSSSSSSASSSSPSLSSQNKNAPSPLASPARARNLRGSLGPMPMPMPRL